MKIKDHEILHKIIDFQSCIIQGRNINAMMHKDRGFYYERTQADIIAVYVNEHGRANVDYIVEEHHQFKQLVEKYIFSKHCLLWDHFIKNCKDHFTVDMKYHHTKNLHEIFKGLISKKDALAFSKELKLKDAVTMPIYAFDNKEEIGYICFIFQKKVNIEITKLEEIKTLFETLLRPLYDDHFNILYSKCLRIDEHLKLLTEQEKRIVRQVLSGKSYPEIGEILNISINTIKTHMKNIFNKYQVNSKIELYRKLNGTH